MGVGSTYWHTNKAYSSLSYLITCIILFPPYSGVRCFVKSYNNNNNHFKKKNIKKRKVIMMLIQHNLELNMASYIQKLSQSRNGRTKRTQHRKAWNMYRCQESNRFWGSSSKINTAKWCKNSYGWKPKTTTNRSLSSKLNSCSISVTGCPQAIHSYNFNILYNYSLKSSTTWKQTQILKTNLLHMRN